MPIGVTKSVTYENRISSENSSYTSVRVRNIGTGCEQPRQASPLRVQLGPLANAELPTHRAVGCVRRLLKTGSGWYNARQASYASPPTELAMQRNMELVRTILMRI